MHPLNTILKAFKPSLLLVLIACNGDSKIPNASNSLNDIKTLPSFQIRLLDSSIVTNTDRINKNKFILLFYFDPECNFCQSETKMLLTNKRIKKNAYVIFLSHSDLPSIKKYDSTFKISEHDFITIGKDITYSYTKFLTTGSFPILALYNQNKNLIKIFVGEVKEQVIETYLKRL